jgi:RNA polymerase sigma-54 factor
MALEQKLSLKLAQKLVMTPSLQQAIKLLQMTRMELETTITQELVENPTLEEVTELSEEETEREREERERVEEEKAKKDDDELDHEESMEDIDLEDYFSDFYEGSTYPSMNEHREGPPIENTLAEAPDFYDHLLWQLHMADVPTRIREIAELIIGNLDPDGFLTASVEEICAMGVDSHEGNGAGPHEMYTQREVEAALALVRSFDPPGIACHDLRESLLLQLDAKAAEDRNELEQLPAAVVEAAFEQTAEPTGEPTAETSGSGGDPETEIGEADAAETVDHSPRSLARRMVEEHWELFLKRQFPAIAKKIGVDLHVLEPAVEQIKMLETRPGRGFSTDRTHYVEPDVYVKKVSGKYVIQVNDDGMPRLRVSRAYRRMLQKMKAEGRQSEAQQFIKDKIRSAVWLIKSLDQRQRTIYKVADSIVKQQQEFLEHGIQKLRPMVLRDVAEDIEMHESTVSRVVSNKYIHTPRGLYPMKFFFHSGIDREYGENISSLTVKRKIEQLIDGEDPKKPLSDSALMRILNREGIQIARRTVAKYRDELNIPSSTDRKQIF